MSGPCTLDMKEILKQWNQKFWIAQWGHDDEAQYRIIRYRQIGRPTTTIKAEIPQEQAKELITTLNLIPISGGFKSATSWVNPTT